MADCLEEGTFWLPSEFFDDFLKDKASSEMNCPDSDSEFCFPTEFPYELGTQSGNHLKRVASTSPQSTLVNGGRSDGGSSNGSPDDVGSPPTTQFSGGNDAVGDLINQAADQVAKLKLNGGVGPGPTKNNTTMGPPRQLYAGPSVIRANNLQKNKVKQQKQESVMWYGAMGGAYQVAGAIYPIPVRVHGQATRAVPLSSGGAAAARNYRAGTGVFLPRRYGNNDKNDKKKGHSTGNVPAGRNFYALNKNFSGNIGGFAQSQPKTNNIGFASGYDLGMVRRNSVMLQHREKLPMSHEDCYLPH